MTDTTQFLTTIPAAQRAALDAAFAAQEGWDGYQADTHTVHDVQDLERVGLLSWSLPGGEWVTDAGRELVVELAHAEALRQHHYVGRHRAPEDDDSPFVAGWSAANAEHTLELTALAARTFDAADVIRTAALVFGAMLIILGAAVIL